MLRNFSVSLVLGLVTLGTGNLAHAGWGSWGGSSGGYGSDGYGSFGGSTGGSYGSYASGGGSHGSWGGGHASHGSHGGWGHRRHHHGLLARLFGGHHHRHGRHVTAYASHGSWGGGSWGGGGWGGSSGGSWGGYASSGYGSSGGSYGGWSYGSHGSAGGTVYGGEVMDGPYMESTPATPPAPMESEPMPPAPEDEGASASTRKGVLVVSVPADAKILVNGEETRSTGSRRRYVSHGLKQGESYRYVVKAITERNGEPVEQTQVAMLQAGRTTSLDFDFNGESIVETSLTVNVPEDARVYLSGHETTTDGEQRRFSTTRIEPGQKWADYLVKVTVDRDGRTLTQERRVTINGGEQTELSFEFADAELAAVR